MNIPQHHAGLQVSNIREQDPVRLAAEPAALPRHNLTQTKSIHSCGCIRLLPNSPNPPPRLAEAVRHRPRHIDHWKILMLMGALVT